MPVKKRKPAKRALPNHRGRVGVGIAQYSDARGVRRYADDIRRLRLAGTTLAGIADWLRTTHDMPVTRERVRQVLTKLLSDEEHRAVLEAAKPPTVCTVCGREGKTKNGLCGAHFARQQKGATDAEMAAPIKVSSSEPGKCSWCHGKHGPTLPGQRTNGMHHEPCYLRWRYHNLPGEKDRVRENIARWLKKKLKRSPGYAKKLRKKQQEAQRRWYHKNAKRIAVERKAQRDAAKKALADKQRTREKALPKKAKR